VLLLLLRKMYFIDIDTKRLHMLLTDNDCMLHFAVEDLTIS